jgi:hypothetical protein
MRTMTSTLLLALACAATGCSKPAPVPPTQQAPGSTAPAAQRAADRPLAAGETRYACDSGTTVTLRAAGTAEAVLPDGQSVRLTRITGSTPTVYTGQLLYFTLDEDGGGARLSQEDAANELRCTKQ